MAPRAITRKPSVVGAILALLSTAAAQSNAPVGIQHPPAAPGSTFRHAFVLGVHSSGTSLLHYAVAGHPDVSMLTDPDTGLLRVAQNEGQFMQTTFPIDSQLVKTKNKNYNWRLFALAHEAAHEVPGEGHCTASDGKQLHEAWTSRWNLTKSVLVEKTPANTVRSRCLNYVFEKSLFLVVTRHPFLVCVRIVTPGKAGYMEGADVFDCMRNWLSAHITLMEDINEDQLDYVTLFNEEFLQTPREHLSEVYKVLGLGTEPDDVSWVHVSSGDDSNRNQGYNGGLNDVEVSSHGALPKDTLSTSEWDLEETQLAFGDQLKRFGYLMHEPWVMSEEECPHADRVRFRCPL